MYVLDDILEFIKEQASLKEVNPDDDLFNDLGCSGDDQDEFMVAFSKRFNVDMKSYLWFFHTDEEGHNFGGVFFRPPNERVKHIPITPRILLEFANKQKWNMDYPKHTLPKFRFDILSNLLLVVSIIVYLIYSCSKR